MATTAAQVTRARAERVAGALFTDIFTLSGVIALAVAGGGA